MQHSVELDRGGLRVAFCLAAALLLRSAHVAWSIQRVLAAEAKELM